MFTKLKGKDMSVENKPYSERQRRIYDFLTANPIGVLSTVSPDGDPHGVVIYYHVGRDFMITFLTRSETRKYDNITHDDRVMLTVCEPQSQTTAQISGRASETHDSNVINAIAGATLGTSLNTSNGGLPPITKLEAGTFVAFRIEPVQIRMAVYARPDPGEYEDLFESIESFEYPEHDG